MSAFAEVAALLPAAALIAAATLGLRHLPIMAFILASVLGGPAARGWVTAADPVDPLAKIRIALLLFVVGLTLDLQLVRAAVPRHSRREWAIRTAHERGVNLARLACGPA